MRKDKDSLQEAEKADRISSIALVIAIIAFMVKVVSLFL